ncbi:MAG: toxin-antitoxin system HicB family antitoxin [Clostridia bacterium]|nr:toxin-antitoxin system HicB family antitoxin [Clostridia bacterium]
MKRKSKTIKYFNSLNYPINIVKDDSGSYFAEYPDLKGCMTVAPDIGTLFKNAEDAKTAWFESALEAKMDIPEPKGIEAYSGSFKLRIPKSLHMHLAVEAKKEGISMNQLCVYLLSRELEKHSVTTSR